MTSTPKKGPSASRRKAKTAPEKPREVGKDPSYDVFVFHPWDPEGQAERFLQILPKSGSVLLTSHDNPDPDALASCLALQTLIREKKGLTSRIAIGGLLGRAENRVMSLELDIDLHPIEMLLNKPWDAVVMVDAQPGSGNSNLPPKMPVTAVIDHHPLRRPLKSPFVDVRPEYGAVSTILVEYLGGQGLDWDAKLATALYYAIKSETADLGRGVCDADRRAHFALFDSIDWELLHRILKAEIPGDYFRLFPRGIELAKLYGSVVVSDLGEIPVPDAVAELAEFMLRHEDVKRSLVLGRYENQIVYSIRFTRSDLDAGMVASAIVKGYGTGGGHDQMAGGRIILNRSKRDRVAQIERTIINRFLRAVGGESFIPGVPLITKDTGKESTKS